MYIDLEKAKQQFFKYVKNYDETLYKIDLKKWHSLRVMELSKNIATAINLNEEDIEIAAIIGLLHDIARFEQYTRFKTFSDLDSFDHGDFGIEILNKDMRNYIETDKYDDLIKVAIRNHNKFKIEDGLSQRELLFSKLIRDADKIDIMFEALTMFWINNESEINNSIVDDNILNTFLSKKQLKHEKGKKYTGFNDVINFLSLIFDINFKQSFKILKEKDYINKILNRFSIKDKEAFEKVKKLANNYIEEHTT